MSEKNRTKRRVETFDSDSRTGRSGKVLSRVRISGVEAANCSSTMQGETSVAYVVKRKCSACQKEFEVKGIEICCPNCRIEKDD